MILLLPGGAGFVEYCVCGNGKARFNNGKRICNLRREGGSKRKRFTIVNVVGRRSFLERKKARAERSRVLRLEFQEHCGATETSVFVF